MTKMDPLDAEKTGAATSLLDIQWNGKECWLWRGPVSSSGFPLVYLAGRSRSSIRRFVFELTNRPLRRSEQVTTTCGTHRCVKPAHLIVR